jgi:hypothetical protein
VPWTVRFHPDFVPEFSALAPEVQLAIADYARAVEIGGPQLGRPPVGTLSNAKHRNMKELRPTVNKVEWRVAFAFDPNGEAVLLVAGAKGGVKQTLFYKRLIKIADDRFSDWVALLLTAHKESPAKQAATLKKKRK